MKKDSVDAADDSNGERQAKEVLQRHCNEEQGEKGRALSERDETKLTQRSQDRMISAWARGRTRHEPPAVDHYPTFVWRMVAPLVRVPGCVRSP